MFYVCGVGVYAVGRNYLAERRDCLAAQVLVSVAGSACGNRGSYRIEPNFRVYPKFAAQVNRLNDPEAVRKRSKLMLPAPQISDIELEEIAKMGYAKDFIEAGSEEGSGVTRALLSNYARNPLGMTPLQTSQRTPGGKGDAIMMEAEVSCGWL
jgi:hypothetical protein